MSERLTNSQVLILRSVFRRSGGHPVTLDAEWQREFLPMLARRGLIVIWYRQVIGSAAVDRGPFVTLTSIGNFLAERFTNPAPRGFSGAEQVK